jgi:hypothetical protein
MALSLTIFEFLQSVKIRSLILHTQDPQLGPKQIKLRINNPSLGFEDFEDDKAITQALDVSEEQLKDGKPLVLRFVRFQNVKALSVSMYA